MAKKGSVTPSKQVHPHRAFTLTSPFTRGNDVMAFQHYLNKALAFHNIDWIPVHEDGQYGKQTQGAAKFLSWVLGWTEAERKHIRQGTVNKQDQILFLDPTTRPNAFHIREERRKPKLQKIAKARHQGPAAAVHWAIAQVGTVENPAGSNSGPGISGWEAYWGLGPVYWCGVFAGYAVKKVGKAAVTSWCPYGPDIINDAQAHRNGLVAVSADNAKPGDLVVYWGGEHIGLIREESRNGMVVTVEGNTSFSDGSQSNGGCVALKERPFSDVTVVARPKY